LNDTGGDAQVPEDDTRNPTLNSGETKDIFLPFRISSSPHRKHESS
jgi:hypothetical protein